MPLLSKDSIDDKNTLILLFVRLKDQRKTKVKWTKCANMRRTDKNFFSECMYYMHE